MYTKQLHSAKFRNLEINNMKIWLAKKPNYSNQNIKKNTKKNVLQK